MMRLSKSAYFVHIPKTAGNSVRQALRQQNLLSNPGDIKSERVHHFGKSNAKRVKDSHLSFKTDCFPCYKNLDQYTNSKFSFTIVRNPYDLLVSYYSHYLDRSNTPKNWIDDGWANVNGYHNISSFKQFIDIYCNCDPEEWHVPELNKNLFGQIFDDENQPLVNYAVYFENIESNLLSVFWHEKIILEYLFLERTLISNRRNGRNYKDFYDESMVEMVRKKCEWELSQFVYSFDNMLHSDSFQPRVIKDKEIEG